jgi:hypothetical protein
MRAISRNRRFGLLGLTLLTLVAAACGSDGDSTGPGGPPPAPGDLAGTYNLHQVVSKGNLGGGGSGMPVSFTDGGGTTLTFVSGSLILSEDGSYDLTVEATFGSSEVTMTDYGTYSAAGSSIDFSSTHNPQRLFDGTLSAGQVTANSQFGGIPFEIKLAK